MGSIFWSSPVELENMMQKYGPRSPIRSHGSESASTRLGVNLQDPISDPASRCLVRVLPSDEDAEIAARIGELVSGRIERSTVFESISMRPSSRKRTRPSQ